jgi:hypothetical protein
MKELEESSKREFVVYLGLEGVESISKRSIGEGVCEDFYSSFYLGVDDIPSKSSIALV